VKAVILAGGKGTRLGDLTKDIPKPMLPILGKPLLGYHIEWLKQYGVTEIYITVNHLKDVLQEYAGNGGKWGLNIHYYEERQPMGTVGGIKALEDQLDEDFLVVYGDVLANMHLGYLTDFHRKHKSAATLVLHPNDHPYDSDLVETANDDRITAFHPKPHEDGIYYRNLVNAGVYIFSPAIFSHLEPGVKADFGKDIFPSIVHKLPMYGYNTSEYLKDMGTPDRLEKVSRDLASGKVEKSSYRHPQKAIFLDRDGVLNEDTDLIHRAEDLKLFDFTARAIQKINKSDYLALIATNQSVVARNLCTEEGLREIHNRMETELGKERAWLDAIYYCPHHPDGGYEGENPAYKIDCECRKPKAGMLLQGAEEFHADLRASYMIGDNERDIVAGRTAGCTTVGVATGKGLTGTRVMPDYFFADLEEAVNFIVDDPLKETSAKIYEMIRADRKPFVITLGGNTQAGKSTLATYLKFHFEKEGKTVLKIELDDWILDKKDRPENSTVFQNFRSDKIVADITRILNGGEVQVEGYARHPDRKPVPKTYRYNKEDVVLIEGVIAVSLPELRALSDLKLFKSVTENELKEKMQRYYRWKGLTEDQTEQLYYERKAAEYDLIAADSAKADLVL